MLLVNGQQRVLEDNNTVKDRESAMIKLIQPNYIDCTANNYDSSSSSKPCLPIVYKYNHNKNSNKPRIMIKPQKSIWDLIKAGDFERIKTIKHHCYVSANHKAIEDIEQWVLQYYDELEESKELTELK
jgi:hypothetical protein